MNPLPEKPADVDEDTGVTDVRYVREKIATLYGGDIQRHMADTHALIEPLIETLGLKYGVPADRRQSVEIGSLG